MLILGGSAVDQRGSEGPHRVAVDYAWTGRSLAVIRGFGPSVLPLREGILDGTFLTRQPLPSEGALAKQFGVTRPTVRQGLPERTPGIGSCRSHRRGIFACSAHTVAPAPRPAAYAGPRTAITSRQTASAGQTPSRR
ncbi:GntR family transcriptional regulator [Streptomyces sp. A13(2022)]|uniref:GntR family transcriptional regulator n=1 Tax=Streptomyces sp. A13(2022) TaxID=2964768 RepID=UPI0039861914